MASGHEGRTHDAEEWVLIFREIMFRQQDELCPVGVELRID
jgi:hypothetical protein